MLSFQKSEEEDDDNNISNYLKILFLILFIIGIIKTNENKGVIFQINFNNNINDIDENVNVNEDMNRNMNDYINENEIENINENNNKINKNISIKEKKIKEIEEYKAFLKNKDKPKSKNHILIDNERNSILNTFSKNMGYKIPPGISISIFLDMKFNFGNQLLILNKLIFYCEIIGCKKIILEKDNNLFINNTIYDKKYNITIEVSDKTHDQIFANFNFEDNGNLKVKDEKENKKNKDYYYMMTLDSNFYYNTYNLRIENKYDIFKNEILKNLPKININKNDLYIHIRGGDIFLNFNPEFAPDYAQPPLCFYKQIIKKNQFKNIFIISADKKNPVIDILIKTYKNIIYKKNSIEKDIASLAFSYNIVGSISSFLISIIKLNNNLKYFWEYNRYPPSLGIPHIHHSFYNYTRKYTTFRMEPSKKYQNDMIIWENSDIQRKIMIEDICSENFTILKPNI